MAILQVSNSLAGVSVAASGAPAHSQYLRAGLGAEWPDGQLAAALESRDRRPKVQCLTDDDEQHRNVVQLLADLSTAIERLQAARAMVTLRA